MATTPPRPLKEPSPVVIPGDLYNYLRHERIGKGAFGVVYRARNMTTGVDVAAKFEAADAEHPMLAHEAEVYRAVGSVPGTLWTTGFARPRWTGRVNGDVVLVLDLLGPTVEELFERRGRRFELKTIVRLAIQALTRLEHIHSRGFVHRDIKPDNLMMGLGRNSGTLHVADFGCATRYCNRITKIHYPHDAGHGLTGTLDFASTFTHRGIRASRRDDLESLAYTLVYLAKGSLPWQHVSGETEDEDISVVSDSKHQTTTTELCDGLPHEFVALTDYAKGLEFQTTPDYGQLRDLFRNLLDSWGYERGERFEWVERAPSKRADVSSALERVATFPLSRALTSH